MTGNPCASIGEQARGNSVEFVLYLQDIRVTTNSVEFVLDLQDIRVTTKAVEFVLYLQDIRVTHEFS